MSAKVNTPAAAKSTSVRVSKVDDKVVLEPPKKPPFDAERFWASLDAMGAADMFPDGPPDDPPSHPDPRVFFDQ